MSLESVSRTWLKSRDIIAQFLSEFQHRTVPNEHDEHNAAAIIARLAHAEPPLLICTAEEMKE
jgi:hypothetical protein